MIFHTSHGQESHTNPCTNSIQSGWGLFNNILTILKIKYPCKNDIAYRRTRNLHTPTHSLAWHKATEERDESIGDFCSFKFHRCFSLAWKFIAQTWELKTDWISDAILNSKFRLMSKGKLWSRYFWRIYEGSDFWDIFFTKRIKFEFD